MARHRRVFGTTAVSASRVICVLGTARCVFASQETRDSQDWIWHVVDTSCDHATSWDNLPSSLASRILLPFLMIACVLAVAVLSVRPSDRRHAEGLLGDDSATDASRSPGSAECQVGHELPKGRLWHLDFARICALLCVMADHAGGRDYTDRNANFGQWWALPYFYMTSGMGLMMSKSSMSGYVMRLAIIFATGVGANWTADVINKRDWQHDFPNTIYQMFFIVMLMGMCVLGEPLRASLKQRRNATEATIAIKVATGVYLLITIVAFWFFVIGSSGFNLENATGWLKSYSVMFRNAPIIVVQTGGTLSLCMFSSMFTRPEHTDKIGWIVLAFIYVPKVFVPFDLDSFSHLLALYFFAMMTISWPLKGTQSIVPIVRSYWPLIFMFLGWVNMVEKVGRCDLHPPFPTWERLRMNMGEFVCVLIFVTGAFDTADPGKILGWLGRWALFAYCFHVMAYRLLGSPTGILVIAASMIFFWAHNRVTQRNPVLIAANPQAGEVVAPEGLLAQEKTGGINEGICEEGISTELSSVSVQELTLTKVSDSSGV